MRRTLDAALCCSELEAAPGTTGPRAGPDRLLSSGLPGTGVLVVVPAVASARAESLGDRPHAGLSWGSPQMLRWYNVVANGLA